MPNHILDLSQEECWIGLEGALLVIRREARPEFRIRMDEIAAICVSQPQSTVSFRALGALAEAGAIVVVCNGKHSPTGMLMPLALHHAQTPRFSLQAAMGVPLRKRLWRQIVKSKVRQQAKALEAVGESPDVLLRLIGEVKSGDRTNVEARAAVLYWPRMFGEEFRRNFDAPDANALLNYGYAIARAAMTRAICACGLHPTLGLMHHHRENPYCLADDLLEPWRPLVDVAVRRHLNGGGDCALLSGVKRHLVDEVTKRVNVGEAKRGLFDNCARTARSLAAVLEQRRKTLSLPEWEFGGHEA